MRLSASQVDRFREEGVLVVEDLLTEDDLAPVIAEYADWIDARARQLAAETAVAIVVNGTTQAVLMATRHAASTGQPEFGAHRRHRQVILAGVGLGDDPRAAGGR